MSDLISHMLRLIDRGSGLRECRRCGTALEGVDVTCPSCGSREIARYDV